MVVARVPGPSATAVEVTSGSIDAANRAATVRWSGVDDRPGLTGSMDARRDRRMTAARAVRDGAVIAGLLFLVYLFVDHRPEAGHGRLRCLRLLVGRHRRPVQGRRRRARRLQLLAADRSALQPLWPARVAHLPVDLAGPARREPGLARWARRPRPVAAGPAAGRIRALPRQCPSLDRRRHRARVPLPVDLGVRAPDQGHARPGARLVRGPPRVAGARHRARGHGCHRRGLPSRRLAPVGRVDRLPDEHARGRFGGAVPDRGSRCGSACPPPSRSSSGAP